MRRVHRQVAQERLRPVLFDEADCVVRQVVDDEALPSHQLAVVIEFRVRIPSDADQRSELMPIAIPKSCRSSFLGDGDHRSELMPITIRRG